MSFATGTDSPVRVDSSTSSWFAVMRRQSAGTASPASRDTTSPETSSSADRRSSSSPRCSRARSAPALRSRFIARPAVSSCPAESSALAKTTDSTRIASVVEPVAAEIPAPAASGAVNGVSNSATAAASNPRWPFAVLGDLPTAALARLLLRQATRRGVEEAKHLADRQCVPRNESFWYRRRTPAQSVRRPQTRGDVRQRGTAGRGERATRRLRRVVHQREYRAGDGSQQRQARTTPAHLAGEAGRLHHKPGRFQTRSAHQVGAPRRPALGRGEDPDAAIGGGECGVVACRDECDSRAVTLQTSDGIGQSRAARDGVMGTDPPRQVRCAAGNKYPPNAARGRDEGGTQRIDLRLDMHDRDECAVAGQRERFASRPHALPRAPG